MTKIWGNYEVRSLDMYGVHYIDDPLPITPEELYVTTEHLAKTSQIYMRIILYTAESKPR